MLETCTFQPLEPDDFSVWPKLIFKHYPIHEYSWHGEDNDDCAEYTYMGKWNIVNAWLDHIEVDFDDGEWCFHTVIGKYASGYYIAFLDFFVSSPLAGNLWDFSWNQLRLRKAFPEKKWVAPLIAYGILDFAKYYEKCHDISFEYGDAIAKVCRLENEAQ